MKTKTTFLFLFLVGTFTLLGQITVRTVAKHNMGYNAIPVYDGPKEYAKLGDQYLYSTTVKEPVTDIYTLVKSDVNDLDNWRKEINTHFAEASTRWGKQIYQNFEVTMLNQEGMQLPNVSLSILDHKGNEIWQAKTNNQGRALLWAKPNVQAASFFIQYRGKALEQPVFSDQFEYQFLVDASCSMAEKSVDLMVVMDATGSMRNELEFLKSEWWEVLDGLQNSEEIKLREGVVFYRDYYEAFVTRSLPLGSNSKAIDEFIDSHSAEAGGDDFEVVIEALEEAIHNQKWNANALARMIVIMLDAPPRNTGDLVDRWDVLLRSASMKGIQIVPVVGLKAFGDLEFLMRSAALATNSTCFFLSPFNEEAVDGEIENKEVLHLEWLKELLLQELTRSTFSICGSGLDEYSEEIIREILIKTFPNPCSEFVFLTLPHDITDVYLSNASGIRWPLTNYKAGQNRIDLDTYPSGAYILSGSSEFGDFQKKIVIQR